MPLDKEALIGKISQIKLEISRHSKRAIKRNTPKTESVRQDIQVNLIKNFNEFTGTLAKSWNSLDNTQRQELKIIFYSIRDKVVRAFQALEIQYKVPISCVEKIDPLISEEDIFDDDEDRREVGIMAMSAADFFNLASKLVPAQFDGNPDNLKSFLDALELLKLNSDNHASNAVAFVKTRLTGKARDFIVNENTIEAIIATLKNKIKGESSRLVSARLSHLRQGNKGTDNFANEIESLADRLQKAYISEGVPQDVAQKYTVEATVRALGQNANSEKARLVVEAGTFTAVQDVVAKFVSVDASKNEAYVFYVKHNRNFDNNRRNFRGRGHNYAYNAHNTYRRGQHGRGRHIRASYNNNGNRGRIHNRFGSVRYYGTEQEQENQSGPQQARLGEI